MSESVISSIQELLEKHHLTGWLFYDFRRTNTLACQVLNISNEAHLTRRFFYWVPAAGDPVKIVNRLEEHVLDHLPGDILSYQTWKDLQVCLKKTLPNEAVVAMEYSPLNNIPYISKVDAGTVDLIRACGVEVVSSANLLQAYTAVLTPDQIHSHITAAKVLNKIADLTWEYVAKGKGLNEYDVQQFILQQIHAHDCITESAPHCAVNANSANPHYCPSAERHVPIEKGDFVLIDLYCKCDIPDAVFADITRVAVLAAEPTAKQVEVFSIVKDAQETATKFVKERITNDIPVYGWEVDHVTRKVIADAGYGDYFVHRTGHNLGKSVHGDGVNLDNYESHDTRELLPSTCFTIEPGIYLPGEFGIRQEYDVLIHPKRKVEVTGGNQKEIICLS
ncbi:MAG: M24 family metallopeptidase [Chlamydiales bacterium]|nr:M24 family metallopeptidase [Chlamydiia bacterium]MCP5506759.1 M24 family metallopeptidase [Chlamydiales bacterium]